MHPLFDASSLSDQELIRKINTFSTKLAVAKRYHYEMALLSQYNTIIQDCIEEIQMRELRKLKKDEDPCVFDMEAYLDKNVDNKEQSNIPRWKSAVLNELSNEGVEPWNSSTFNDLDK